MSAPTISGARFSRDLLTGFTGGLLRRRRASRRTALPTGGDQPLQLGQLGPDLRSSATIASSEPLSGAPATTSTPSCSTTTAIRTARATRTTSPRRLSVGPLLQPVEHEQRRQHATLTDQRCIADSDTPRPPATRTPVGRHGLHRAADLRLHQCGRNLRQPHRHRRRRLRSPAATTSPSISAAPTSSSTPAARCRFGFYNGSGFTYVEPADDSRTSFWNTYTLDCTRDSTSTLSRRPMPQ